MPALCPLLTSATFVVPWAARVLPERKFSSGGHAEELMRCCTQVGVKKAISYCLDWPVPPRCPQHDCKLVYCRSNADSVSIL